MKKRVILIVCILMVVGAGLVFFNRHRPLYRQTYAYSESQLGNPLMGYAPSARQTELDDDIHLLYVDIRWKDLEPQKGRYSREELEKVNHFAKWRSEGKHLVLRFVLDYPGKDRHLDIPDWLYDELDDPGDWYDSSYGKGFSPNYQDKKLRSYYQKAVQAMGQRWGADGFVSFIELGGLGHWGEWHVNLKAGIRQLPSEDIREDYVSPWLAAFPEAHFLMRRPFSTAKRYGLGLYNDMAGDPSSTQEWLDWIEQGGTYDQTGEKSLLPMPDSWKTAPIGGELTSSISMKKLMTTDLDQTLDLVRASHTTFLGPKIAEKQEGDSQGYRALLQQMGYRLWISSAEIRQNGSQLQISTSWENAGAAPFYKDWKAYVYLEDEKGRDLEKVLLPLDLTKLLPGQKVQAAVDLAGIKAGDKGYRISVGIVDPMTGEDAIAFAVAGQEDQKRLKLFAIPQKNKSSE